MLESPFYLAYRFVGFFINLAFFILPCLKHCLRLIQVRSKFISKLIQRNFGSRKRSSMCDFSYRTFLINYMNINNTHEQFYKFSYKGDRLLRNWESLMGSLASLSTQPFILPGPNSQALFGLILVRKKFISKLIQRNFFFNPLYGS